MFDKETQELLNRKLKEHGLGYVHINTDKTSLTEEEIDEVLDFIQEVACKKAELKNGR